MKIGDIVKGEITAIKEYGAFVKIDEETSGLVHISELSDNYVRDVEDYVEIGDVFELKVVDISEDGKISLSYKALNAKKKRYNIELKIGFAPLKILLDKWLKNNSEEL